MAFPAWAVNCYRPLPPDMPDGATASKEEMLSAGNAVRAFMDEAELYLDCLKVQESLMPPNELSARKQAVMAQQHNDAVADMERLASTYNAAVRAYKSRSEGSVNPTSSSPETGANNAP